MRARKTWGSFFTKKPIRKSVLLLIFFSRLFHRNEQHQSVWIEWNQELPCERDEYVDIYITFFIILMIKSVKSLVFSPKVKKLSVFDWVGERSWGTSNLVPRSCRVTAPEMYTFNRLAVECLGKTPGDKGISSVSSRFIYFPIPTPCHSK